MPSRFLPKRFRNPGGSKITLEEIAKIEKIYEESDFGIPKYLLFARTALRKGFRVSIYEAQKTVSKYVTVTGEKRKYKVRFSNHKPIPAREKRGDCDFFVGHTNLTITTTRQAWDAMMEYFNDTDSSN